MRQFATYLSTCEANLLTEGFSKCGPWTRFKGSLKVQWKFSTHSNMKNFFLEINFFLNADFDYFLITCRSKPPGNLFNEVQFLPNADIFSNLLNLFKIVLLL